MVRTQICLTPEEIQWLKNQAANRGISMAAMVRELIRRVQIPLEPQKQLKKIQAQHYTDLKKRYPFIGCLKGHHPIDVYHIDDYLYGAGDLS